MGGRLRSRGEGSLRDPSEAVRRPLPSPGSVAPQALKGLGRRSPGEGAEPSVPTRCLPRLLVPPSPASAAV